MVRFISLHMFFSLPLAALSSRVRISQRTKNMGPHKCTIQWEVPGRGIAKTSFPVKSCLLHCKPTFTDNYFNKKFADVMEVEKVTGKSCKCLQSDGTAVLRMVGNENCDAADATAKCFEQYKTWRTSTYVHDYGKQTFRVERHLDQQHERTFDYSLCEENACQDGDCIESSFPSIMEGRSEDEKKIVAEIIEKKKKKEKPLTDTERDLIDQLTPEEIEKITGEEYDELCDLYREVADEAGGLLTVKGLREIYKKKLQGTGFSVDHHLNLAGLTDDDEEIDCEGFKHFVKPEPCEPCED